MVGIGLILVVCASGAVYLTGYNKHKKTSKGNSIYYKIQNGSSKAYKKNSRIGFSTSALSIFKTIGNVVVKGLSPKTSPIIKRTHIISKRTSSPRKPFKERKSGVQCIGCSTNFVRRGNTGDR